jgi:hypothetical protein
MLPLANPLASIANSNPLWDYLAGSPGFNSSLFTFGDDGSWRLPSAEATTPPDSDPTAEVRAMQQWGGMFNPANPNSFFKDNSGYDRLYHSE